MTSILPPPIPSGPNPPLNHQGKEESLVGVIRKLDPLTIDQIKAGEVVERPVNVVKELVENALDAGAKSISVELLDGGKQRIQVTDNGCGILPIDLSLSVERHATSKLKKVEDLWELDSFGFRGEALASMASVSSFTLRSRHQSLPIGYELEVPFGIKKEGLKEISIPVGTTVCVSDLFLNVPVRKKFLKSAASELTLVIEFLTALALQNEQLCLSLKHNGKVLFHYPSSQTSSLRAQQIFKTSYSDYHRVECEDRHNRIEGYLLDPQKARSHAQWDYVFVNGRFIRDKWIKNAIFGAYKGLLGKGLVPSYVLFLQLPPSLVDVNAHPSKTLVRFTDPLWVQDFITRHLQESMHAFLQQQHAFSAPDPAPPTPDPPEEAPLILNTVKAKLKVEPKGESRVVPQADSRALSWDPSAPMSRPTSKPIGSVHEKSSEKQNEKHYEKSHWGNLKPTITPQTKKEELLAFPDLPIENHTFKDALYCGQIFNGYLIFEDKENMLVVDQHAFHERVLFESYRKTLKETGLHQQHVLSPIMIPVPSSAYSLLEEAVDLFKELGFQFDLMPNSQVALLSYPSLIKQSQIVGVFDSCIVRLLKSTPLGDLDSHPLEKWSKNQTVSSTHEVTNWQFRKEEVLFDGLATMACHNAVRVGESLSLGQVEQLLVQARGVDFFVHCPHGRPVFKAFQRKEVGFWFQRPS